LEEYAVQADESLLEQAEQLIHQSQNVRMKIRDLHPEPTKVVVDLARGYQSIAEIKLLQAANVETDRRRPLLRAALKSQFECTDLLTRLPAAAQNRHVDDFLALSLQNCGNTCDKL